MASVFKRDGSWYLQVPTPSGKWKKIRSRARTKTEAQRLADDLERNVERVRLGLEPDLSGHQETLSELMAWWLSVANRSARSTAPNTIRKHIDGDEVGALPIARLRPSDLEGLLDRKAREGLSAETLNIIRGLVSAAFSTAKRLGHWPGANPVEHVGTRKVLRKVHDYLRTEEVPRVLAALDPRWRPLFACAIYAGLRKGELMALQKRDVDLDARILNVHRSHERDTAKGGHAGVVPVAVELVPYLQQAMAASPSHLVFPASDGSMMRHDSKLQGVLRRALGRAGIVEGWLHTCRRCKSKGDVHEERHADSSERRCPRCSMKLWPMPLVRRIRFHDLRHTCASLLTMAGAPQTAVQAILRHASPVTTRRYQHLSPDYLRGEVDRLRLACPRGVPDSVGVTGFGPESTEKPSDFNRLECGS